MFLDRQRICALTLSLPALLAGGLPAQQSVTRASISGRVLDPGGGQLPGASVTALCLATNQEYTARTDDHGRFRLAPLPVGEYRIRARAGGFAEAVREIELGVGSAFDLTLSLPLARASTDIRVTDAAPVIETGRSQIAETVGEDEISALPYEGRNFLDLSLLVPGVSSANTASTETLAETSEVVGPGYSVNSQRNLSNSFVVDGLSANDDAAGVAGNVFSMDAISELQVVTSGGQAEFGRAMGGYFNVVTRSGTNQARGTAYGFLRNQRLNAANALTGATLPLTQGQYGASLGGPVRRDRSFLFGNLEQQRLNTDGVITIGPAATSVINARLREAGYPGSLLPPPAGPASLYPTTLHTDNALVRADDRLGPRDQLSARLSLYRLASTNARGVGGLNAQSNGTSVHDTNVSLALGNVATLSPRSFNETRAQYVHDRLSAPPNDPLGPQVTISGVATFGRSTASPTARGNDLYEAVDNLVTERGAHTVKTGVDLLLNRDTITYPQALGGAYLFASLADLLTGSYSLQGYTQNFGAPTVAQTNPNAGLYVEDQWRPGPGLTANAGLRYDLELLHTIRTNFTDLSPRAGLAWSPGRDGRTVVRAGYGLYYDRIPLRPLANALLSADNTTDPRKAVLEGYSFSPGAAGAPQFPGVAPAPPAGVPENFSLMDRSLRTPRARQASLGVERQIAGGSSIGLSYQQVRGEHLIGSINTNIAADGSRPDPTRGNIKPYSSLFDSSYDGLEASLELKPSPRARARLSYTWSKASDDVGEFFFSAPINNLDPGEDRGRSDDDQRHRLAVSAELNSGDRPRARGGERLLEGWRLGGILQYDSAPPFNITTGGNTLQATAQRPCSAGLSLGAQGGINPCTEALPGAVIGRNRGRGFDLYTLNARLSRSLPLREGVRLEAIAEAFNALNHRNDMIPNATWGPGAWPSSPLPGFGAPTAVGDPRSLQLAARITF